MLQFHLFLGLNPLSEPITLVKEELLLIDYRFTPQVRPGGNDAYTPKIEPAVVIRVMSLGKTLFGAQRSFLFT